MALTDIGMITKMGGPQEVSLSPWPGMEEPFVCQLRRPTLFQMAQFGGVPNPLLPAIEALFSGDNGKIKGQDGVEIICGVMQIGQAALWSPSYKELKDAGVEPTDMQYNEIYAWVLGGAAGMERFRVQILAAATADVKDDGDTAESAAED